MLITQKQINEILRIAHSYKARHLVFGSSLNDSGKMRDTYLTCDGIGRLDWVACDGGLSGRNG